MRLTNAMPETKPPAIPIRFFDLLPSQIETSFQQAGRPSFRARQVLHWVYRRGVTDPSGMTNLPQMDRSWMTQTFQFCSAEVLRRQDSTDGTIKLLLGYPGGATAETVMIPDADRYTACVSSQVGCPVGCKFCASGIGGVKGNLSAGQIVEQIVLLNRMLAPRTITNVVFMGMGEPLANYAQVMQAVRILHDPQALGMSARRITLSTVGIPARIRQLAEENLPVNLAISLHAPNESLRRKLIPWAEHFALQDILDASRDYFDRTGREITLEYILLAGVNDQPWQARELAGICRTLRANVNLIRYNPVQGLPFGRPSSQAVVTFQRVLRAMGVNAHVRKSRGRDIDAACGQLRRKDIVQT